MCQYLGQNYAHFFVRDPLWAQIMDGWVNVLVHGWAGEWFGAWVGALSNVYY